MRGQGRVYRPKVRGAYTRIWWLDYGMEGKQHRESSGTESKRDALALLRQRIGDRESGKLVDRPDKLVFAAYTKREDGTEELVDGLRAIAERQYVLDGNRSLDRVQIALDHLEAFFGRELRVARLSPVRIDAYAKHRLAEGASPASVNYEKAVLRRGFKLCIKKGLLAVAPPIDTPKVENRRSGFFEPGDFAALLLELPAVLRPLIRFLKLTGWRRDEGRLLLWANVDRDGEVIRLNGADAKSGEPRVFPYGAVVDLKAIIDKQWEARRGLHVFHDRGEAIGVGKLRSGWKRATKRAGLAGRLVHDLRRTCARDMRRAGLAESDIMELCGWETREMFKRYCIRDEAALATAAAKLNSKQTANTPPAPASADSLSSDATT